MSIKLSGIAQLEDGRWRLDLRDEAGKRKRKICDTKAEAAELLCKWKTEIKERKYFDIDKPKHIPFKEFASEYIRLYIQVKKHKSKMSVNCINNLLKFFGGYTLDQINLHLIEEYKAQRLSGKTLFKKKVGQATLNRDLATLKSMLNRANEWDCLKNPELPRRIKKTKENNERDRYLDPELSEYPRLMDVCDHRLKRFLLVSLFTGMRFGEIQKLTRDKIVFEKSRIRLEEQKSGHKGYVYLNDTAKVLLQGELDFNYNPRKALKNACKHASIPHFTFHDLRRTFATYLFQLGVDYNIISLLLRHEIQGGSIVTRRYAHLKPEHLITITQKLDDYIGIHSGHRSKIFGHFLDTLPSGHKLQENRNYATHSTKTY